MSHENPFSPVAPASEEIRVKKEEREARAEYNIARENFDFSIGKESPELKQSYDKLLASYREKFGEKGEMFIFKLLNINQFQLKLSNEEWRKEMGEETIRDGFERMLRVVSAERFERLLRLYPNLLEDFDIKYATKALYDEFQPSPSHDPISSIQKAFCSFIQKPSFDRSFRNECGTGGYPATMEMLENCFNAYLDAATCDEAEKILAEYAQLYSTAYADPEKRAFLQKDEFFKPIARMQGKLLGLGYLAAGQATDRFRNPYWHRNDRPKPDLDPVRDTGEVMRGIVLPAIQEQLNKQSDGLFKIIRVEDTSYLGENYAGEWLTSRGAWVSTFYDVVNKAWKKYCELIKNERMPHPNNISAAVVFDAEGRAAGRILKRFWQESGAVQQPRIYFLNPKHISTRGELYGFQKTLSREEALELIAKEYPGLIKDIRSNDKAVLLADSTVFRGRTFREMGEIFSDLIGSKDRIKYWTLTGHTGPGETEDWKIFGNFVPGQGTGFVAPDNSPDAIPTLYSRKSEKFNPTEMAKLTDRGLDCFFEILNAGSSSEALTDIADRLLENKQYCVVANALNELPLTREQIKEVAYEALANDAYDMGSKLVAKYVTTSPAQPSTP